MSEPFAIPYRTLGGSVARPYLILEVTGVNGIAHRIAGIVDSGADTTTLPLGYAPLLGYTAQTLQGGPFVQAGGTGVAHVATVPCQAFVPEIPEVAIEIHPSFIDGGQMTLWGRRDFMAHFHVTLLENEQQFVLTPVDTGDT